MGLRICCSRPQTPPGRPTTITAATASIPDLQPAARTKLAITALLIPVALYTKGVLFLQPSILWCAGWRPTVRRQLFSDVDSDRRGAEILEHQVFLSVGHDEYWSAGQRANVEAAQRRRPSGVFQRQLDLLEDPLGERASGARYPVSHARLVQGDACQRQDRSLVQCLDRYVAGSAFQSPGGWWRSGKCATGTIFTVNGPREDAITVPESYGRLRFWRNTSVATLAAGQVATLPLERWATSGTKISTMASGLLA